MAGVIDDEIIRFWPHLGQIVGRDDRADGVLVAAHDDCGYAANPVCVVEQEIVRQED